MDEVSTVRVLVACECSGVVRRAFRARGHDAWSCDLLEAEDGSQYHYRCDILELLGYSFWDLMIGHPECRFMANSGALRLYVGGKKVNGKDLDRWSHMAAAADFFRELWSAPVPKICLENPVMHGHALGLIGVKPTQTIQPWQFGEDASKRTCLWLKGLPLLKATSVIRKGIYANQTPTGQNKLGPSPQRSAIRARTYQGIADAMATQWGNL